MTRTQGLRRAVGVVLAIVVAMLAAGCAGGAPRASSAPAATQTPATSGVAAATEPATSATAAALLDLNGTYRYTLTQEDADAADDPEADTPDEYPQTTTVVLKDGELEGGCFGAAGGTYDVDGDRITFHSIEYDADSTVTFALDGQGNLHLTPVPPMDPGDAFQCFSKPWTKIE